MSTETPATTSLSELRTWGGITVPPQTRMYGSPGDLTVLVHRPDAPPELAAAARRFLAPERRILNIGAAVVAGGLALAVASPLIDAVAPPRTPTAIAVIIGVVVGVATYLMLDYRQRTRAVDALATTRHISIHLTPGRRRTFGHDMPAHLGENGAREAIDGVDVVEHLYRDGLVDEPVWHAVWWQAYDTLAMSKTTRESVGWGVLSEACQHAIDGARDRNQ